MNHSRPLPFLLCLVALCFCVAGVPEARAQGAPAILENGYRNVFGRPSPVVPPGGTPEIPVTNDALFPAYQAQRQNGTAFGGFPVKGFGTLQPNNTINPTPVAYDANAFKYPSDATAAVPVAKVVLRSSIIGRPLALFGISYSFGAVIPPPLVNQSNVPTLYRAEPLDSRVKTTVLTNSTTGAEIFRTVVDALSADSDGTTATTVATTTTTVTVGPNPKFYWSKHAQKVYATQPGTITIKWREAATTTAITSTYVIATAPDQEERTLYWTENGFRGPLVEVPAGRVNAVNIIYNTLVPKEVVTPYEPWLSGVTDFTESDPLKKRYKTFYYDNNLIHAYNVVGRVFVEYLGNPRGDGTSEQKGIEIVNVIKETAPVTKVVSLGERVDQLRATEPGGTATDLEPKILAGLGLSGQPYLHQQVSSGGTKTSLYAVRETQPGVANDRKTLDNEVLVYWLETSILNLKWPKQFVGYVQQWPEATAEYSVYARPDSTGANGLAAALATAVQLDSANNPALVYQDDPANVQALLLPGNQFYTKVTATDPTNRALLRFTKDDDIWFERVFSQLDENFPGYGGSYVLGADVTLDQGSTPLPAGYSGLTVTDPNIPGKVYQEGVDYFISREPGGDVLRTNYRNYQVDAGFNPGTDGGFYAFAVQADGKIIVAGQFNTLGGQPRTNIGRLNSDGSLDTTFNPGTDAVINALAVQSDGKILVGGAFTTLGGQPRSYIGRLNADGSLDTTFNPGANSSIQCFLVQPDGKILVGGSFTTLGGQARSGVGRLNADGTLDIGFNPGAGGIVNCLAIQSDGKILVGGSFSTLGGQARSNVGRLNANGTLDTTVTAGADQVVYSLAVQLNGKILVGGNFTTLGGQAISRLGRLNADGTVDTAFNLGANSLPYCLAVQPNGQILVGGFITTLLGQPRNYIGRLNADGTLDMTFNPGASPFVYCIAVQSDGKILVGGTFTTLGGQARSGIGRLAGEAILPSTVTTTLTTTAVADIGTRLAPPSSVAASTYVGYIHQPSGTAFNVGAYKDPFVEGFDEAAKGAIIGVNALAGNDKLEVWWYRKSTPVGSKITGTYWPSFVQKYALRWPSGPTAPTQIVLASNKGSDDLPSLQATGSIYTQNNPALPGYNPNEEHALMLNGRAWALRDDLNLATSSERYVLLNYTEADTRPAMRVFQVTRGNFDYPAIAGKVLQSPMPLPILPPPLLPDRTLASYEMPGVEDPLELNASFGTTDATFIHYQKFTWTDRKGILWVYRGPHQGSQVTTPTPTLKMRYFYQTLPGFNYPSLVSQPAVGTVTPYLRSGTPGAYTGDPVTGVVAGTPTTQRAEQPLDVIFRPQWPDSAPELRVGETLTLPKVGLPQVRGQQSAEFIYQQSVALNTTTAGMANRQKSARLFDPTRAKVYPLSATTLPKIPASVNTSAYLGKTYFPNLPPHLSSRLYFDPAVGQNGSLVFKGVYMNEVVGEKYLQLNVMSAADIVSAKGLTPAGDDKSKWDAAIDGLVTTLETFVEDPGKLGTYIPLRNETATPRTPIVINGVKFPIPAGTSPLVATVAAGSTVPLGSRPPTKVDELAEVYYGDTAVDSYAISASGGGKGYVVLAVGNGRDTDFTSKDGPVSLEVFKVSAPLYRGELKVINSQNPLDEKLTLQHTGDFAGRPEEYDFEWRYAPPADGLPLKLYSFVRKLIVPGAGENWNLIHNPVADAFDPAKDYKNYRSLNASVVGVPLKSLPGESFVINDGNGTTANGTTLPDALLRRTFSATERPLRLFLSLDVGANDGAVVYLNGAQVAAYRAPGNDDTPTTSVPATAPAFDPLPLVFEINANALVADATANNNVFTVELYTTADAGSTTTFNLRLEGSQEVENLIGWLPVGLVAPETASTVSTTNNGVVPQTTGIQAVEGKNRHTIQGTSILTLSDNWFIMRYRANALTNAAYVADGGWSKWTEPQLAEGWIKRVLAGINPFQQRVKDLFNHQTNTSVSLVEQAGKRWEGNIALNLDNINDSGLVEIYETVLNRGKDLSISGTPAINYGGANDALLLAAGYLSDLYMILGNEAYADAANSTIAFNTDGQAAQYGDVATALFAFKGQLATVLDEELSLLRGRDDSLLPGTQKSPIYNRLIWNYTRGISSGEAIYALNYNIKDRVWDTSLNPNNPGSLPSDGIISAADAAIGYPQGHGDAYGHYLTALTGYYSLLNNPNFSWTPRIEAVLVLGTPVSVDYQDERKFAAAAVAVARTASQTLDLTYRQQYSASETAGWSKLHEEKANTSTGRIRNWGTDDWASRGGQGALFHWVTANSLLPAVDPNPNHSGIQKIDRTTVPELAEIAAQAASIQQTLDNADSRVNPLGLAPDALTFDISPTEVDAGKTHYEQVYERATVALQNAVSAFNNAKGSTQFLRQQEDTLADQRNAIDAQEQAYSNQLIELYGTPYTDDIGPGKTYKQDYAGPDLLHSMYVDLPELFSNPADAVQTPYSLLINPTFADDNSAVLNPGASVAYTLNAKGDVVKPSSWSGRRVSPGRMQTTVSDLLIARQALKNALDTYNDLNGTIQKEITLYESTVQDFQNFRDVTTGIGVTLGVLQLTKLAASSAKRVAEDTDENLNNLINAQIGLLPTSIGLANDPSFAARGASLYGKAASQFGSKVARFGASEIVELTDAAIEELNFSLQTVSSYQGFQADNRQLLYDVQSTLKDLKDGTTAVDAALRNLDQTLRNLYSLQAEGDRIQQQRLVFRQHSAAIIQGYRTRDFAFRAFRNEALERYKALFDLSARYTYLAARAYDYETGLLDPSGNAAATGFYEKIVQARALGVVSNGVPQFAGASTGDPGLSGVLAAMAGDWSVAKTRLGFNNPDNYSTTFSLRQEKLRLVPGVDGDLPWKDKLSSYKMANILDDPDVKRYCMQVADPSGAAVPGIVIPFSSTIATGYNFFGQPLAGGDHTFTPSSFSTKIRSSGLAFAGYVGMDSPTTTSGTLGGIGATSPGTYNSGFSDPNALSATPYIYLIPAGVDSMRSPPLGDASFIRTWLVQDQAIPLPFNIGNSDYSTQPAWVSAASLSEPAFTLRKHQAFRAVPDGTNFQDGYGFTNARLIGRSAWNSQWKIVIPGNTLLNDPNAGLQTFINTVKDIKLHLETYSYSGN